MGSLGHARGGPALLHGPDGCGGGSDAHDPAYSSNSRPIPGPLASVRPWTSAFCRLRGGRFVRFFPLITVKKSYEIHPVVVKSANPRLSQLVGLSFRVSGSAGIPLR